jgi:glutathione S-transferase
LFGLANPAPMSEIWSMIELIQFPFSPFCLPTRFILEFSGAKFKVVNVPPQERSLVWKLTGQQYYGVPVIRDGAKVVFDDTDDQQIVAKYLDGKLKLGLFPAAQEGVQSILWRAIENEIEGATFRLNDIYYRENVAAPHALQYLRFKERKFGRGCIDQWHAQQKDWLKKLETGLIPFDQMLAHSEFLLGGRPLFVDFDLLGMLENFLYSGHYSLPKSRPHIRAWHQRMKAVRL